MTIRDTDVLLPYSQISSVTFKSGEDINLTTLNNKIYQLLVNDEYICNIKKLNIDLPITTYGNLTTSGIKGDTEVEPWTVTNKTLIWHNNDIEDVHCNILYPIIPENKPLNWSGMYDEPTKVPDSISKVNQEIRDKIGETVVYSYDYILEQVYNKHITVKENGEEGNIVRCDAAFFASLNRHEYIDNLFFAGYRWAELLLNVDSVENVELLAKHVKYPTYKLDKVSDTLTANVENTYGIVSATNINQYILNDDNVQLVDSYVSGEWSRKISDTLVELGGIVQITPTTTVIPISSMVNDDSDLKNSKDSVTSISYSPTTINFPEELKYCLNVTLNSYSNGEVSAISATPENIKACPITLTKISNSGFDIKVNPDYVNHGDLLSLSSKTYLPFNIMWTARGIQK